MGCERETTTSLLSPFFDDLLQLSIKPCDAPRSSLPPARRRHRQRPPRLRLGAPLFSAEPLREARRGRSSLASSSFLEEEERRRAPCLFSRSHLRRCLFFFLFRCERFFVLLVRRRRRGLRCLRNSRRGGRGGERLSGRKRERKEQVHFPLGSFASPGPKKKKKLDLDLETHRRPFFPPTLSLSLSLFSLSTNKNIHR